MTSPSLTELTERIVQATLDSYGRLPKHGKPAIRNNGVPEWTILASISLTTLDNKVIPISLGTGVKVLPATRLPPLGDTVHDCHAEVLARRGFVRWLLAEAERDMSADSEDTRQPRLVQWDAQRGRFALAPGVQVWLYVSALPCGDASTLHTSVHQATEVADAFAAAPEFTVSPNGAVRGRKGYETYGAIRTKPGRADSPPSISFSCSDKIATWNVLGLQGGLLSALFGPVYLDHIVVGGVETPALEENSSEWEDKVAAEAQRALYGRLEHVKHLVQQPYRLASPHIHLTPTLFPFSKPAIAGAQTHKDQHKECATSTVSLSHIPAFGKPEVIMNGCAQTSGWKAPGHTLLKDKQRSRLSKIEIMRAFLRLKAATGTGDEPADATYYDLKHGATAYQRTKAVIRGTPCGGLSDAWARLLPHEFPVTAAAPSGEGGQVDKPGNGCAHAEVAEAAPFAGWITCGRRYESFTCDGALGSD